MLVGLGLISSLDEGKKSLYTNFSMNNNDRNSRTLIICFVIAFMVLVPLRILEDGQANYNEVNVLGEQSEPVVEDDIFVEDDMVMEDEEYFDESEVILPNAE